MATSTVLDVTTAIAARGRIGDDDVAALRRAVYPDGIIAQAEADALLALERAAGGSAGPDWRVLFVEALVDHVVNQTEPRGAVADPQAEWLMGALKGRLATANELEMLVRIMESARAMPPALAAFALEQVKHGCLTGEGPTTRGRCHYSRIVDAADVDLLRRILFAAGGDGSIDVTRAEAEVLFDLHDQTVGQDNDPGFCDLFVRHCPACSGGVRPAGSDARDAFPRRGRARHARRVRRVRDAAGGGIFRSLRWWPDIDPAHAAGCGG
jgi:hypothetical protein